MSSIMMKRKEHKIDIITAAIKSNSWDQSTVFRQ